MLDSELLYGSNIEKDKYLAQNYHKELIIDSATP